MQKNSLVYIEFPITNLPNNKLLLSFNDSLYKEHLVQGTLLNDCFQNRKIIFRRSRPEVFCKRSVLRNFAKFTGKQLCQGLFFKIVYEKNFFKKNTLAQVFSCEFCEISKNIFFTEHLRWLLPNLKSFLVSYCWLWTSKCQLG